MPPKVKTSELIALRVMREQQWAYDRRLEHLSYREMRSLANRPPEHGGLGYDLSEQALKALVDGYVERMRETLEESREQQIARELADLDKQHRALVMMLGGNDAAATAKLQSTLAATLELTLADVQATYPDLVVPRDDKVILAALAQLRQVGESRRKLLGLDAPTLAKVDVVHHDAVAEELNAMLARAGRDPVSTDG